MILGGDVLARRRSAKDSEHVVKPVPVLIDRGDVWVAFGVLALGLDALMEVLELAALDAAASDRL